MTTGCFVQQVDQQGSQKEIVLKRMDTVRADPGHAVEARVCAYKWDLWKLGINARWKKIGPMKSHTSGLNCGATTGDHRR
jgi:hypothetical protein